MYGSTFKLSGYQQSSTRVRFSGTWRTVTDSRHWGGSLRSSTQTAAKSTFSFTGRQFAWVAQTGPTWGSARVYVNGLRVATVNLAALSPGRRQVVFSMAWSRSATRTVVIQVSGTAGHPKVGVDGFLVAS